MSWTGFGGLNLAAVEAEQGRKSLKPGSYALKITEAEIKDTKDGYGKGLKIVLTDPSGAGAVEDFINVHNRNAQAVEIGLKRLKALLVACGHPNPNQPGDVKTLVGRMVGVHVEQGDDWVDKNGNKKPGGGEPRKSGAYYKLDTTQQMMTGSAPTGGNDLNDDIPF